MNVVCDGPSCRTRFKPKHDEHRFCSEQCLIARLQRNDRERSRELRKAEAERRRLHREQKERLKTIPDLEKAADRAFSAYIRARDYGRGCCSCVRTFEDVEAAHAGKPGGTWDCCHYLPRAEYPQHRYDEHNAALGCKNCNGAESKRRRGSRSEYIQAHFRKTLVDRFGEEKILELENNKVRGKRTRKKLRMIAQEFRERARQVRKERGLA